MSRGCWGWWVQALLDFEKVLQRYHLVNDDKAVAWKACCTERIVCNRLTYMYGLIMSAFDTKGNDPNALRERISLSLKQLKIFGMDGPMILPIIWDNVLKAKKGTYSP